MQLLYARVTQAIAGTSNFREVAEIAFTDGADESFILDVLAQLGIGTAGPDIETSLGAMSRLAALPGGRFLNEPDWSEDGKRLWLLSKH